ncbi:hypothetical protein L596_007438 [Steinernema carpocapsae]|uniref:Uncharacterized protein n=1 Tax=Steinernema carpocapsae TaxID=34508 RepID=A0A4U5P998_STECR|nr:hypothetical protein L596_007438 [Steinernema carpocapsae]
MSSEEESVESEVEESPKEPLEETKKPEKKDEKSEGSEEESEEEEEDPAEEAKSGYDENKDDNGTGEKKILKIVVKRPLEDEEETEDSEEYTDEDEEYTGEDEDSYLELDTDSDMEYCINETFALPKSSVFPKGDLYPVSNSSRAQSPSDYDSDFDISFDFKDFRDSRNESRNIVSSSNLIAPPPIFTASVFYDGMDSDWDSAKDESASDYDEYCDSDEDYHGRKTFSVRPGSSGLGVYMSPTSFTSDEDYDGKHYHDTVVVGCTVKLVDKIANQDSDSEYTDSEYYDSEYDEDESEYYDDEDEEDEEEDEEVVEEYGSCNDEETEGEEEYASYDDEEEVEEVEDEADAAFDLSSVLKPLVTVEEMPIEEMEEEQMEEIDEEVAFDMAAEVNIAPSTEEGGLDHLREVTYTKDQLMETAEERAERLRIEEKAKSDRAISRTAKGVDEKAAKKLVPSHVVPSVAEEVHASAEEKDFGTQFETGNVQDLVFEQGESTVGVIPTFVRPSEEKTSLDRAEMFNERRPSTDFAKKAVIQPMKVEKVKVSQSTVKTAPTKIEKPVEEKKPEAEKKVEEKKPTEKTVGAAAPVEAKTELSKTATTTAAKTTAETAKEPAKTKVASLYEQKMAEKAQVEDKTAARKSVLNMKDDEKAKAEKKKEELAKQKARTSGAVSAMRDRFKDPPAEPEPIVYKRSSRLTPKDEEERPKRIWKPIVKPEVNDEFDKQMEELRAQMKSGSTKFQSQVRDLNKTVHQTADEAKRAAMEDKHKATISGVTDVFTKADGDYQKWKERREAEHLKDLEDQEKKKTAKPKKVAQPTAPAPTFASGPVAEPKRTVRKLATPKPTVDPVKEAKPDAAKPGQVAAAKTAMGVAPKVIPTQPAAAPTAAAGKPAVSATPTPAAAAKTAKQVEDRIENKSPTPSKVLTENNQVDRRPSGVAAKIKSKTMMEQEARQLKKYSRRKTEELMKFDEVPAAQENRKRKHQPHRRNRFTRNPNDIDVLLGWDKENTFEKMEAMFAKAANNKMAGHSSPKKKKLDHKKIWISDLQDIDKLYKSSELRDIQRSVEVC